MTNFLIWYMEGSRYIHNFHEQYFFLQSFNRTVWDSPTSTTTYQHLPDVVFQNSLRKCNIHVSIHVSTFFILWNV